MACKLALPWIPFGAATVFWAMAMCVAQAAFGPDIGRASRKLEERIELQLKGGLAPPLDGPAQPERTHEDAIEPWELVHV